MTIKIGKFDVFNEMINNKLDVEAILNLLGRKGLVTQSEFDKAKKEAIERLEKENPELIRDKKEKKSSSKKKNKIKLP